MPGVKILNEITRAISNNQLDYILVDETLRERSYVTSFNNFISDHKSITARIGLEDNLFTKEFKAQITFDREFHQQSKVREINHILSLQFISKS